MIQITKGKVLKDDVVEISYIKNIAGQKPSKVSEEHKDPPHSDLKDAMASLSIHAAVLAEFIPPGEVGDIENPEHADLINFHVSSFSTKGDDGEESIVITGQKTLKSGKVLIFNTPSIRFADESDTAYAFADDLKSCLEALKFQFREYLNGKHAADPQTSLDFEGPAKIAREIVEEFNQKKLEKPSASKTAKKNKAAAST